MADFTIKQGDLKPSISATLSDSVGVVNLTGYAVRFHMRHSVTKQIKVDAAAVIVSAAAGTVRYDWVSGDTDDDGVFQAEWEATGADTKPITFPNDGYLTVAITEEVA